MLNEIITNEKLRSVIINLTASLATTGVLLFGQLSLLDTPIYVAFLLIINILSQVSNSSTQIIPVNHKLVLDSTGIWTLVEEAPNAFLDWLGLTARQLHLTVNIILVIISALTFLAGYMKPENQAAFLSVISTINTLIYQLYDPNKKIPEGYKVVYNKEGEFFYLKKLTNV